MLNQFTIILLNLSKLKYFSKILGPISWALLFCLSTSATEDLSELAANPQWLNLYRYSHVGIDNNSTVTNASWFFSAQGRRNPLRELKKAIEVLASSEAKRCAFPARTLFLKSKGFLKAGQDSCPKYEYFARKLKLENIWIVFASYYVNNPSSAFGHTLFKIEGKGNQQNDFLQYGANFAAQTTTVNPLIYALLGLIGGFKGNYGLLPYFVKIGEYNDSESRDLWEYKLNLTAFEKQMFLAHLWEMDQAQYDYYYLTQNCSYHLLTFLDAIRPSLHFKDKMSYFVLPAETLSIVNQAPGLVSEIRKRPSQFNIVRSRFNLLSTRAQKYWDINKYKEEKSFHPGPLFNSTEKADYLDFAIDYIDLKYRNQLHNEVKTKGGKFTTLKRKIQIERSKVNIPTKSIPLSTKNSPDQIHPPRLFSAGYEWRQYEQLAHQQKSLHQNYTLGYRFAFHELLDDPKGAPRWSELVMGNILARYDKSQRKLYLDQFTLFRTHANQRAVLSPLALSWLVEFGARDHIFTEKYDFGPYIRSHIGVNWQGDNHIFRFIIPFELDYSSKSSYIKSNFKVVLSPRISSYHNINQKLRLKFDAGFFWRTYLRQYWGPFSEIALQWDMMKGLSLETGANLQKKTYQSYSRLKYYF